MEDRLISKNQHTAYEKKRLAVLCIGTAGMLFIGVIFAWSTVKIPLFRQIGFTTQELATVYSVSVCFFCLGNMLTGLLLKNTGNKLLFVISAMLISVGFCCTAALRSASLIRLCLLYGAAVGCGVGLSYNCILSLCTAWFPDRKGICSGVLMMGFGLSSVLWAQVMLRFFSEEQPGWRSGYCAAGVSIAVAVLLCAGLLYYPPETAAPQKQKQESISDPGVKTDYKLSEVVKRRSFWIYYIYGIFAAAVGSTVLSFAMDVGKIFGVSDVTAAAMVGIVSVGNGLGRVLCGLSYDKFGLRRTLLYASSATVAAPVLMLAALPLKSIPLATASFLFSGLSFGTCPTIGSALMLSFYGQKYFPANYGLSNSKMIFSSAGATAASWLLLRTEGYTAPYVFLLLLAAASFALSKFIKEP